MWLVPHGRIGSRRTVATFSASCFRLSMSVGPGNRCFAPDIGAADRSGEDRLGCRGAGSVELSQLHRTRCGSSAVPPPVIMMNSSPVLRADISLLPPTASVLCVHEMQKTSGAMS